jgi:hypothetical protein
MRLSAVVRTATCASTIREMLAGSERDRDDESFMPSSHAGREPLMLSRDARTSDATRTRTAATGSLEQQRGLFSLSAALHVTFAVVDDTPRRAESTFRGEHDTDVIATPDC